jgi:hypothetical protein
MVSLTHSQTLIEQAQAAGLQLAVEGEQLVIDGPEDAETLALDLLAYKADVIATLALLDHAVIAASDFDAIPTGWQTFHSIPCGSSPDGWAEFSQLRATPTGPLLCVHCGEVHKDRREAS